MDQNTTKRLITATKDFYARTQASFSATRQHAWPGWERIASAVYCDGDSALPLRLLDIGCGNMRFEHFLARNFANRVGVCHNQTTGHSSFDPAAIVDATMVDAVKFADADFPGTFIERDVISDIARFAFGEESCRNGMSFTSESFQASELVDHAPKLQFISQSAFDLSVAFGVAHHIPGYTNKCTFLEFMIDTVAPGGYVAISFWQPLKDERIAKKALATTSRGLQALEISSASGNWYGVEATDGRAPSDSPTDDEGTDLLLGWQDDETVFRYCHHFSDAEIERYAKFATSLGARVVDLFSPEDGSDHLNTYMLLQRLR